MSIYSNLKELYKDTNDIVNGKNIAWKIIYMLQNISFIIICMICLVDKCKIRTIILENIEFGISQSVCDFLNKYIVICVIFYFSRYIYVVNSKCFKGSVALLFIYVARHKTTLAIS